MIFFPKALKGSSQNTWLYIDKIIRKGLYEFGDKLIDSLKTKNYTELENYEFLLLQGKVKGFLLQHEFAKNILTDCLEYFTLQNNDEKIVECLNHLAITYLRNGEIEEAIPYLERARKYEDDFTYVVEQIFYISKQDYQSLTNLNLPQNADAYTTGFLHSNLAVGYKKQKNFELAIENYLIARTFFQNCQHFVSIALIENNLANVFLDQNEFDKAHIYVDKAINLFKTCENHSRYASGLDTKANIFLAEKKFIAALELINESIAILLKHKDNNYLLESYETKIKICKELNDFESVLLTFNDALNLAKTYCGEEWTRKFVKRVSQIVSPSILKLTGVFLQKEIHILTEYENAELIFPEGYQNSTLHCCVVTTNSLLFENFGIKRNELLITAQTDFQENDLVAFLDTKYKDVLIGTLHYDFGIMGLEIPNQELKIIEKGMEYLGKIIGRGDYHKTKNKIFVNLLT